MTIDPVDAMRIANDIVTLADRVTIASKFTHDVRGVIVMRIDGKQYRLTLEPINK